VRGEWITLALHPLKLAYRIDFALQEFERRRATTVKEKEKAKAKDL